MNNFLSVLMKSGKEPSVKLLLTLQHAFSVLFVCVRVCKHMMNSPLKPVSSRHLVKSSIKDHEQVITLESQRNGDVQKNCTKSYPWV